MRSFLVGLGVGIGLGILFAPMSGQETRNNIRERATDLADTARETFESGRDRVRAGIQSIRGQAERVIGGGSTTAQAPTGTEPVGGV